MAVLTESIIERCMAEESDGWRLLLLRNDYKPSGEPLRHFSAGYQEHLRHVSPLLRVRGTIRKGTPYTPLRGDGENFRRVLPILKHVGVYPVIVAAQAFLLTDTSFEGFPRPNATIATTVSCVHAHTKK